MSDWSDIVAAGEQSPTVGKRHGLRLVTDLLRAVDDRGPMLAVEVIKRLQDREKFGRPKLVDPVDLGNE